MSTLSSPARFSGDFDGFYDSNYTVDISKRMRVPHRIRVVDDDDQLSRNTDAEKLEMFVPGRILVAGQDQHIGMKSPPRELHLEKSLLPTAASVRVQTPPRVLTLEDHPFPTVEDDSEQDFTVTSQETIPPETQSSRNTSTVGNEQSTSYPSSPANPVILENTGCPSEELIILRRHVAKLSRRILVLENDSQQRQQKEIVIYTLGVAYFVFKTLLWFHRHW
uniref:Mitochondrial fission factor n=1 Tax=Strigamia maritima TaxID=126957 RepID=T1JB48_STRMM